MSCNPNPISMVILSKKIYPYQYGHMVRVMVSVCAIQVWVRGTILSTEKVRVFG